MNIIAFPNFSCFGPKGKAERRRLAVLFHGKSLSEVRKIWDEWDGITQEGEDAHAYLNMMGDGKYCAV